MEGHVFITDLEEEEMMQTIGLATILNFLLTPTNKTVYVGKTDDNSTRIVAKSFIDPGFVLASNIVPEIIILKISNG